MTTTQLKRDISKWSESTIGDSTVVLSFISYDKRAGLLDFKKVSMRADTSSAFKDIGCQFIKRLKKRLEGDTLALFDPIGGQVSAGELPYVTQSDSDILRQIQKLNDVNSLEVYDHKTFYSSKLHAYSITFEHADSEKLHLLTKYNSKKELTKKSLVAKVLMNNQFDQIKEPVFLFDGKVDCAVFGDYSIVMNRASFMSIFKYYDQISFKGSEAAKNIAVIVPMIDSEQFVEDCKGNIKALIKLTSISQRPHFNTMTINRIKQLKADGYGINLNFENVDGVEKLDYTSEHMWDVLKVMDDDYLESPLTNAKYEASIKKLSR